MGKMRAKSARRVSTLALVSALIPLSAGAQTAAVPGTPDPPNFKTPDATGVDLGTGQFDGAQHRISIGTADSGMGFGISSIGRCTAIAGTSPPSQCFAFQANIQGYVRMSPPPINAAPQANLWSMIIVTPALTSSYICGASAVTTGSVNCTEYGNPTGTTFIYDSSAQGYRATLRDGTTMFFAGTSFPQPNSGTYNTYRSLSSITRPDGEVITYSNGTFPSTMSSSRGYALTTDGAGKYSLVNSSVERCSTGGATCTSTSSWPSITFPNVPGNSNVVDALGNATNYKVDMTGTNPADYLDAIITKPSGRKLTVTFDTNWGWANYSQHNCPLSNPNGYSIDPQTLASLAPCPIQHVKSVSDGVGTWNYNYQYVINPSYWLSLRTTVTDPRGGTRTAEALPIGNVFYSADQLNRVTNVTIAFPGGASYGTISAIQAPDGSKVSYGRRSNGDIVLITHYPNNSTTTGLTTQYKYALDLNQSCTPMTCHKALAVIDPKGYETDYTYDPIHGGVLTETRPADANGVRPQKRYTYAQFTPKTLDSSGALVASPPIWLLTQISECMSATVANPASCVGTAAEKVTTYGYSGNNLWQTSVTTAAGDGSNSRTVTSSYDNVGNVISVKGPRTDVDDTRYVTYDLLRRKVFEIGTDPDGGGPLPRQIVHHVYDTDGNEIRTELGTGNATNGSDFVIAHFKRMTYDAVTGRITKTEEVAP